MMRTFKALSAVLSYPDEELQQAVPVIRAVLQDEAILSSDQQDALEPLLREIAAGDIYDLQERYVLLFDRSRTLSLNLFEHIHGESRERGGAMVDLLETYRAGGFDLQGPELPDHLPVLLEFLSTLPLAEARGHLEDAGPILAALAARLVRRETPYAAALVALAELAGALAVPEPEGAEEDPEDLEALDAVYAEAQVTFGPDPSAGCPVSRDLLARMDPNPIPAPAGATI